MSYSRTKRQVLHYPTKGGRLPYGAGEFIASVYPLGPDGKPGYKGPSLKGTIGGGVLGVLSAVYLTDYPEKYGTGFAVLYGLASAHPVGMIAQTVAEGVNLAGEYGYGRYHARRKLNFGSSSPDVYGTMGAMRMQSLQNMQRGHNSIQRFVGNEARYFHK